MKKYIKHLKEYDDSDLLDLMGDLGDLGFENYQGWVFSWDSPTEKPLAEVMIAPGPREAFNLYRNNGWFGPDIDYAANSGTTFKNLEEVFKYLKDNKIITSYEFIWGLKVKGKVDMSEFHQVPNGNPFAVTSLLITKFDNSPETYNKFVPVKITKIA